MKKVMKSMKVEKGTLKHLTGIGKSYYVCTLPGQVQKGSIKARKNFKDQAEWQFALEEEIQYKRQASASEGRRSRRSCRHS